MISQDTSAYGVDVKHRTGFHNGEPVKTSMVSLCEQLSKLGIWTRLHYVYPYPHVDDVIPLMAEGKILPYLDIPLQHASPRILKLMKRPGSVDRQLARIKQWREICPELTLRSTFIVGFPGETEEDFQMLLDFLKEARLDRVAALNTARLKVQTPMPCLTRFRKKLKKNAGTVSCSCSSRFPPSACKRKWAVKFW